MSYRVDLEPEDLRSVRRHGPGIRTAVGLLVFALAVAGSWAGWRTLHHAAAGGAIPVIHADTAPLKVPPTDPGGMRVPDQNIAVLNGIDKPEPKVEQLLPPPETPLPRPVPPEPAVTDIPAVPAAAPMTSQPVAATAVAPQSDAALPAAPAAAPVPEAAPAVPPAASMVASAASPPPALPAAAPQPIIPAVAPTSGWRLQLAALRSPNAAAQELKRLKRAHADLLGKIEMASVRADLGARGTFYRIEAGPLADKDAASRICAELRERKVGCILVRP